MYFYNQSTNIDSALSPVPVNGGLHLDTLGSAPRKSIEWNEQRDKAGAEPENVNQESIKNESFPGDNPNANNELSRNGHHHLNNNNGVAEAQTEGGQTKLRWSRARKLLWAHFISGYSQTTVLIWSFWWALATGGFFMVWSYVQPLWHALDPDRESIYNGAAEALVTLFGALAALLAGLLNQKYVERFDVWILTVCSVTQGGVLLLAALTSNVFVSYAMYILFGALYHFMITITSATIAKLLAEDSFALIFGINTLFALFFQTLLTIFVASGSVTTLVIREQFVVYASYFLVLGVLYGCSGLWKSCRRGGGAIRTKNTSYDIRE